MRRVLRYGVVALAALILIVAGAVGFGMRSADEARVRAFADAVRRWQRNPDYREASREYVVFGVGAMQSRVCGASAGTLIMLFRSVPGLPDHLAVDDTSAAHYDAFTRGELSAYLHLASEQGVADGIAMIEQFGRRDSLPDADVVAFLAGFKLPVRTVADAGAVAGMRRLLADVDPRRPFPVRGDVPASLRSSVEANLATMSRAEQAAEFARFDANVRAADPELWRSKQVCDFLAGIWAQGYGQIYLDGVDGFFRARRIARQVFAVAALALIGLAWKARRRAALEKTDLAGPVTA